MLLFGPDDQSVALAQKILNIKFRIVKRESAAKSIARVPKMSKVSKVSKAKLLLLGNVHHALKFGEQ